MDQVEFLRMLDNMNQEELKDYLEAVWREEIDITPKQEQILIDHLKEMRRRKVAVYISIWLLILTLLQTIPEYDGAIKRVFEELPEPAGGIDYDLMWVTEDDGLVCPICKPLHEEIIGENLLLYALVTHPNCRCEVVKVYKGTKTIIPDQQDGRAMNKLRTLQAGAVRALSEGQKRILEVLAAPFGSPDRKDRLGQFLSPNTDYMIEIGDQRPLLYFHGFTPRGRSMKQPPSIGRATATRIDSQGLWMRGELVPEGMSELADRTWKAALEGTARASTGSVNYLERHDEATGEVYCWPIAELSVFDGGDDRVPVSDDAVVLPLRALFDEHGITLPDNFEAGEDKREEVDQKRTLEKDNTMDKKTFEELYAEQKEKEEAAVAEKEAMRAEILKEIKTEPQYRSTFNVNTIDDKEARKDEVEEENFAYIRNLIEDAKIVAAGGQPRRHAMRVLEETQATELGPMVPEDLHNKIHGLLGKYSLPDKLAERGLLTIYNTDKLTFSVPAETTAMSALSDIAEEGAYTANEMAFAAKTATMQKVGNYLSVTEEALEDQDLFQQYLVQACAKAIALSKNVDFHALVEAIAGTAVATTDTLVDGEVVDSYYDLAQEYREGSCYVMSDATLSYVRQMLVATPRAYGEFGFQPMSMGEIGETFLNKPVFTNGNWTDLVGGTDNLVCVTHANFNESIFWVERRKMSIFVDPYSTKLSAGTVNFLPSARYAGVTVNAAGVNNVDCKS